MRRSPRPAAILLSLVVASGVLAGCGLGSVPGLGGDGPDSAAERLAAALTRRDVSTVRFSGAGGAAVQPRLAAVLDGMGQVPAKVSAGDLDTHGDRATGRLTWTWQTGAKPWTATAPVTLEKSGDAWLPVWRPSMVYARLGAGDRLDATTLLAQRGDITGAHGTPIVTLRLVDRIGIDKARVGAARAVTSARALARLTGVAVAPYAARVRAAGGKAFVEAITFRRGEGPSSAQVAAVPGAVLLPARTPLAPTKDFAAALLGRVGAPTAEIVARSDGRVQATDQVGIGGLEARYDDELRGRNGVRVDVVAADGSATTVHRTEAVPGHSLSTTLDVTAQDLAQQALAGTTSPSALVAIRPSTGQVVAAASGPGSDGQNTATYSRYAPGSTFKVVTSLALLRAGVTPETPVECPASLTVDGKVFTNYSDYPSSALGRIPFRTAIADSCNTAVIGQRDRVDATDLKDAAAALGLGVDHDLGFPAYFGQVTAASSQTGAAADLIGQGTVLASPMAMATVAASVAKGARVVPRLLLDSDNSSPAMPEPDVKPAEPLTAQEATQLRALMRGVVTDGSGRGLLDVPGDPVLAKTGTAEYGDSAPLRTHAWMIADHGDLAVAVFVGDGASGSGTAGPIVERFLRGYR